MSIELEKEEVNQLILMMEGSSVPLRNVGAAIILLNKFKEAAK